MRKDNLMLRGRLFKAVFFLIIAAVCALFSVQGAFAQSSNDVVLVFPFENTSNRSEYNWVGQSFSDALTDLLSIPGLVIVSTDERELAYQRVRLPFTTLPSRATAIKIAREAKASIIVVGTYSINPAQGTIPASLHGTARVIKVNEGRLMGETMPDGRWATREYDFGGALTTLQAMQGRLAYQILYQHDKSSLVYSQTQFVEMANRIPQKAFESYVKGVQTDSADTRLNYLKNALHFYGEANAGAVYPQAAFELGQYYLARNDWQNAAYYFSQIQKYRESDIRTDDPNRAQRKKEPLYPEAAFYTGLAYFRLGDAAKALAALVPLTQDVPLTGIFNNTGAISLQAARAEKRPEEKTRLISQGVTLLQRASQSSAADDAGVQFNYAYALFLAGKYAEAAEQLKPIVASNQKDGQSYFLLAKALERTGKQEAAADADNQARRFLPTYAVWQTDWQKSQSTSNVSLRLRNTFTRDDYFSIIRDPESSNNDRASGNTQDLLEKARQLYIAGRDEDALPELRRVLTIEPMSAEAYMLIGRIQLRRGDQDAAISALKTSIFWDAKLIDAHVLLGRIFLERGDRAQAMAYARSAMQIDPNNQEAVALQRQVDTGGK
jgi:tetratricopeptide (TPR) repeat protein